MYVGVDGCKSGWVAAAFGRGQPLTFSVHPSFKSLTQTFTESKALLIDIPIGLVSAEFLKQRGKGTHQPYRWVDLVARKYLRNRRSSIFHPPTWEAIRETNFTDAGLANYKVTGKKISKQSYAISPKILEVNELLAANVVLAKKVFEFHPEVAFKAMIGHPLQRKKTAQGSEQRLSFLRHIFPTLPDLLSKFSKNQAAARDDLLDATCGAILSHAKATEGVRVVHNKPETDAHGLIMNMIYNVKVRPWRFIGDEHDINFEE